jgi:hypothetical protein
MPSAGLTGKGTKTAGLVLDTKSLEQSVRYRVLMKIQKWRWCPLPWLI